MPCLRSVFVSAIIWKISGSYDLEEIESLLNWAMYSPEHYINDPNKKSAILSDERVIEKINKLLNFIFRCDGVNVDVENSSFSLSGVTNCELRRVNELIDDIPEFDITYYANLKLTNQEIEECHRYVEMCTDENSDEVMACVESIDNFFMKSYAKYLLIYDSESNYKWSRKKISNSVNEACKRGRSRRTHSGPSISYFKRRLYSGK